MFDLVHKSEPFRLNQTCGCLRLQLQNLLLKLLMRLRIGLQQWNETKWSETKWNEMNTDDTKQMAFFKVSSSSVLNLETPIMCLKCLQHWKLKAEGVAETSSSDKPADLILLAVYSVKSVDTLILRITRYQIAKCKAMKRCGDMGVSENLGEKTCSNGLLSWSHMIPI